MALDTRTGTCGKHKACCHIQTLQDGGGHHRRAAVALDTRAHEGSTQGMLLHMGRCRMAGAVTAERPWPCIHGQVREQYTLHAVTESDSIAGWQGRCGSSGGSGTAQAAGAATASGGSREATALCNTTPGRRSRGCSGRTHRGPWPAGPAPTAPPCPSEAHEQSGGR